MFGEEGAIALLPRLVPGLTVSIDREPMAQTACLPSQYIYCPWITAVSKFCTYLQPGNKKALTNP